MVVTTAWQANGRLRGIAWMRYGCGHRSSLTDVLTEISWSPGGVETSVGQIDIA